MFSNNIISPQNSPDNASINQTNDIFYNDNKINNNSLLNTPIKNKTVNDKLDLTSSDTKDDFQKPQKMMMKNLICTDKVNTLKSTLLNKKLSETLSALSKQNSNTGNFSNKTAADSDIQNKSFNNTDKIISGGLFNNMNNFSYDANNFNQINNNNFFHNNFFEQKNLENEFLNRMNKINQMEKTPEFFYNNNNIKKKNSEFHKQYNTQKIINSNVFNKNKYNQINNYINPMLQENKNKLIGKKNLCHSSSNINTQIINNQELNNLNVIKLLNLYKKDNINNINNKPLMTIRLKLSDTETKEISINPNDNVKHIANKFCLENNLSEKLEFSLISTINKAIDSIDNVFKTELNNNEQTLINNIKNIINNKNSIDADISTNSTNISCFTIIEDPTTFQLDECDDIKEHNKTF